MARNFRGHRLIRRQSDRGFCVSRYEARMPFEPCPLLDEDDVDIQEISKGKYYRAELFGNITGCC